MQYAFETASRFNSELLLLHTIHIPILNPQQPSPLMDFYESEAYAKEKLQNLGNKMQDQCPNMKVRYQCKVKFGLAEDEILDLIGKEGIDLVVMGTKGAQGIGKIFGTISADIALKASCPVIVVPENYQYRELKQILYATDAHGIEASQMQFVIDLARNFDAHISILTIHETGHHDAKQLIAYGVKMIEHLDYKRMSFHVLKSEDIAKGIEVFAKKCQAGLIVMASHERNFFQGIFSDSLTKKEAYRTQIPLLAMHKEKNLYVHL